MPTHHTEQACFPYFLTTNPTPDPECKIAGELINGKKRKVLEPKLIELERFANGKTISRYDNVNPSASDYPQVYNAAKNLALRGENTIIMPKMDRARPFDYSIVYSELIGTPYEGKTPDIKGENGYIEVKGYNEGTNGKRALRNMLSRAVEQADRIILQRHPEWNDRYVKRAIQARLENGEQIKEVWLQEEDGTIAIVFKSTEG